MLATGLDIILQNPICSTWNPLILLAVVVPSRDLLVQPHHKRHIGMPLVP